MPDPVVAIAYRSALEVISAVEPDVAKAIVGELESQRRQLKLIASENYASPAVLLAMGNWLSDKYAEGTPGHRFYAGCEMVDRIETLATDHAKALFGAEHAYVQPHSGIDANLVAYWAILAHRVEQPVLDEAGVRHVNDLDSVSWDQLRNELHSQRMMGMALDAGGHLTHGFRPNISGKLFDQASYGVDPTSGLLDYDAIAAQAREFRPLVLVAGYSAYPRNPNFATLAEIAHDVGATLMVDMAHFAGLVAGKVLAGDLDPVAPCRCRDLHHPQVTARSSRWAGALHRGVRTVRGQGVPNGPWRPATPRDGGQGHRFVRGPPALIRLLCGPDRGERPGARRRVAAQRSTSRHRGNRQPPRSHGRRHQFRPHRSSGRGRSARCGRGHQSQLGAR